MVNTVKICGVILLGAALFGAGYFWSESRIHSQMDKAQPPGSNDMAGMNMTPGTAMVTPQMQQLMGVRTAIVEARPLSKTIRAVGTVAFDESRVKHVHSKVDGWVDKLYVNTTGQFVSKGQPLFSIYSPDLVATQ